MKYTASKVSVVGFFLVRISRHSDWAPLHIQSAVRWIYFKDYRPDYYIYQFIDLWKTENDPSPFQLKIFKIFFMIDTKVISAFFLMKLFLRSFQNEWSDSALHFPS